METKRDEQVIYLKDLLFSALYQWKKVLLWGVVLAVLLGGFKGVSAYKSLGSQQVDQAALEQEMESYKTELENLERKLETVNANVEHQQIYLEESLLMKLDAYDHYEVYLSGYLSTDYQILPGMSHQNPDPANSVLRAYGDGLSNDTSTKLLAEAVDTKPEYLREFLTVHTNHDARSFSVLVKVPDQAVGDKLQESLKQVVTQLQTEISQTVASHTVSIRECYARPVMDQSLLQRQQEAADKLMEFEDVLVDLEEQKSELQPPVAGTVSATGAVKSAVVFAVLGGALGVMLVVLAAWLKHIFGAKVYSRRALTNRTGIKVFGCVKTQTKMNPVDAWLRVKEGRNTLPADKQNALMAYSVAAAMGNEGTLQLCGGCSAQARSAFAAAMGQVSSNIKVCDTGDLLADVSARQTLNQTDCVLLLEQCGVSTYERVQQQMNVVAEHGKKLLGCVLMDG